MKASSGLPSCFKMYDMTSVSAATAAGTLLLLFDEDDDDDDDDGGGRCTKYW